MHAASVGLRSPQTSPEAAGAGRRACERGERARAMRCRLSPCPGSSRHADRKSPGRCAVAPALHWLRGGGKLAVVEIPDVSPRRRGLRPFSEFEAANDTWPRGDRPAAIREAAAEFRARFATPENRVRGDPHGRHRLGRLPAEVRLRRRGERAPTRTSTSSTACRSSSSRTSTARCGRSPTSRRSPRGPAEAPYYAQQIERLGEFLSYKVLAKIWHEPDEALRRRSGCGRRTSTSSASTTCTSRTCASCSEPPSRSTGEAAPRPPLFPNAKLIAQRKEWDTFASLHPMQWAWYVEDGIKDLIDRQRRADRRRRRARQGRARSSGRRATPTATTRSASTPPTASGSPRRTASPPTTGTRTCRRSPASARRPSSSAAR